MSRFQHVITPIHGQSLPRHLICVEIDYTRVPMEDRPNTVQLRLLMWCGYGLQLKDGNVTSQTFVSGTTVDEFWAAVDSRLKRGGVIWCVSERATLAWGMFGIWDMLDSGQLVMTGRDTRNKQSDDKRRKGKAWGYVVLEDPPVVLDVKRPGLPGRLRIVDSANYGLEPSPSDTAATRRSARTTAFMLSMMKTLRDERLGSLAATAASQSMRSWKSGYLQELVLCHTNANALLLEGDCYYGGRCEAFRLGVLPGRITHLDYTSLYASLCATASVPTCLMGYSDTPTACNIPDLLDRYKVFADVTLEDEWPCYPFRDRGRDITIWPVGRFRTCLADPELRDAVTLGRVKRWHRIAWYNHGPALSDYARKILQLLAAHAGGRDMKSWLKGLGVSLVGKLGQKDRRWVDDETPMFHSPWDHWYAPAGKDVWDRWRSVAMQTQREEIGGWSHDACPQIAAYITSLGRLALLRSIRIAGWSEVYYVDTDALMVSPRGFRQLVNADRVKPDSPGFLRTKGTPGRVRIYGIKHYEEDGVLKMAGAHQEHTFGSVMDGRIWITPRLSTYCRTRTVPRPVEINRDFDPHAVYRHGIVDARGRVIPHQLNLED